MANMLFSFQLPEELMQKMEASAEKQMISVAALIRIAVQQYLKNLKED